MKRVAEPVDTNELCSYGCGSIAKFRNGSGNLMCCERHNSCPANRKKNSIGLKRCSRDYHLTYQLLSDDTKTKMNHRKNKRFADFSYNGRGQHKNALILERGHKCECCNNTEWLGEMITLELEHVDADRKNNTRDNLKLLCPNCHSKTPTWRGRNRKGWAVKKYSDVEMIEAIKSSTNLNQVIQKLDLRYGSAKTIFDIMSKYDVRFMGC